MELRTAKTIGWLGAALAVLGGAAASAAPAVPAVVGTLGLLLGMGAVAAAAVLGSRLPPPDVEEDADAAFRRDARRHAASGAFLVVIFLLILIEVLAGVAGTGDLTVFGNGVVLFVRFYGVLLGLLVVALAGILAFGLSAPDRPAVGRAGAKKAWVALGVAAVVGLLAVVTALGLLPLNSDRAPFVLNATLAGVFFAVRVHAGLPNARQSIDWLEREERVRRGQLPRKLVLTFAGLSAVLVLASIVLGLALEPRGPSIAAVAGAMICVLLATFSLGVTRYAAKLEEGMDDIEMVRHKRRLTLNSLSVALTLVGVALAIVTVLAALAQAGAVALFAALLTFFVANYPIILAFAILPLLATSFLRLSVSSDVAYTDRAKATTIVAGGTTVVLVFFGTFVGSGLAQGTGIAIENAVLMMSGAAISTIVFVHARAQLPGIFALAREQVKTSQTADLDTKARIERQMLTTYIAALVFIVGFVAFFAASSLGVIDVESTVGTDSIFFVYLIVGIVLLGLVVVRYFQGVNLDPAWRKPEEDIGKRRLTPQELNRYLILGVSGVLSSTLAVLGILVHTGVMGALGPLPLEPRFSTDFYVFAILIGLGPYGWYYNREQNRIRSIDSKFPEFLRDLAESQRSGMTLTEAVITSSKGNYGALTPEIRKMAAQIEWGIAFPDALERFSKRVKTPLIERTVSLITQAAEAGGNVVDVLTAASDDAREIQQIVKERTNSMAMYVYIIYIAYGVFLTVVAVLNAQFIPEVAKAVKGAQGATIGGITFRPFDEQEFKTLFFHGAIIQALGGGFVAGVMQTGKPIMGLKHAFVLVLIGYILFRFIIGA